MPDREKTIKGLESLRDVCNAKADMAIGEGRTAWAGYASVVHLALDMIREQEPVEPKEYMSRVNRTEYLCGACDSGILYGDEFCRHCGREVKWDA